MLNFANRLLKAQKTVRALKSPSSASPSLLRLAPSTRLFRTSALSMVAQKIDGTAIAKYAQTFSYLPLIN
jgi:hypothetical protein